MRSEDKAVLGDAGGGGKKGRRERTSGALFVYRLKSES